MQHPVNVRHIDHRTSGERASDWLVAKFGSWTYILTQTVAVVLWVVGNAWLLVHMGAHPFDRYPFILLNLMFSTQASYAAPLILMAQNRQSAKDRLKAEYDYQVNVAGLKMMKRLTDQAGIDCSAELSQVAHLLEEAEDAEEAQVPDAQAPDRRGLRV